MSRAALSFLQTLQTNFRVKRHESDEHEEKWVQMMVIELSGFSAEVLEKAAADIVRTRKNEYFPILAECLAACREAKRWLDVGKPKLQSEAVRKFVGFEELADQLIHTAMGRQAANEGWILMLHDYIRNHGRLPDEWQIPRMKATFLWVEQAHDDCRKGDLGPTTKVLQEFSRSFLKRRHDLIDKVLNGGASK